VSSAGTPVAGWRERVRASHLLAGAAALVSVVAVRGSSLALVASLAGALALAVGLARGSRPAVVGAGAALFGAALLAAAVGGSLGTVLVAGFCAVLAADLGEFALGIERDVDPSVATTRVELVHALASVAVALVTGGTGYVLFRSVPGGGSVGLVALLFGGVVLVWLLE
jgi:hypothetical protein